MGVTVTLVEAQRLIEETMKDPASAVGAVVREWEYPLSREAMAIADLYDLYMLVNSDPKKPAPKRYPRPWQDKDRDEGRRTAKPTLPQEEVLAALRYAGHNV